MPGFYPLDENNPRDRKGPLPSPPYEYQQDQGEIVGELEMGDVPEPQEMAPEPRPERTTRLPDMGEQLEPDDRRPGDEWPDEPGADSDGQDTIEEKLDYVIELLEGLPLLLDELTNRPLKL